MKLIDKDALLAEIEKRYKLVDKYETNEFCAVASREELVHLKKFINSLGVKEVDLEKEYIDYIDCDDGHTKFDIAKHFFELGLKAQKGE